jgi:2-haloalkanoic acid dehalogenase type II
VASRVPEPLTRDEILEAHARHESYQQKVTPAMPYDRLLQVVFKRLAEEWSVPYRWEEAVAYGASVGDWPAFPDSASTLQYLKKYFKLVVVSNVDNRSFRTTNEKLAVDFDAIVTAEDVGSYKPSRNNFEYLFSTLASMGVSKDDTLHVADSVYMRFATAGQTFLQSARPGSPKWNEVIEAFLEAGHTFVPTMNVYDSNRDLMRARRADWHDEYTDSTSWKYFQPQRGGHGAYFYRWSVKNEVEWKESFSILLTFLDEYKNRGGRVCAGSDSGFMYQV